MKLLVDINVVLDVVLKRAALYQDSSDLLARIDAGAAVGLVATHTVTTAYYVIAKQEGRAIAHVAAADLLRMFGVVPAARADLKRALGMPFRDYEDAVQAVCADRAGADYIVTRDLAGFRDSPVPARQPAAVLRLLI